MLDREPQMKSQQEGKKPRLSNSTSTLKTLRDLRLSHPSDDKWEIKDDESSQLRMNYRLNPSDWHRHRELSIHKEYFKRGIIVVRDANDEETDYLAQDTILLSPEQEEPKNSILEKVTPTEMPLIIKSRELYFSDKQNAQIKHSQDLLLEMAHFDRTTSSENEVLPTLAIIEDNTKLQEMKSTYVLVKGFNKTFELYYKKQATAGYSKLQKESRDIKKELQRLSLNLQPQKKLINLDKSKADALGQLFVSQPTLSLTNKHRKEEVFLPIPQAGLYVYPWLSSGSDNAPFEQFSGFERFCFAGCIFGSSLQGQDSNGYSTPLIKHDVIFYKEINKIDFNPLAKIPYEEELFVELNRIAGFIKAYGTKDKQPELVYHLPYLDYILFGIELFIRNKLTFSALHSFVKTVLKQMNIHIEKVTDTCKQQNISLQILSPFENLFDMKSLTKEIREMENPQLTYKLLGMLGINKQDLADLKSGKTDKIDEKILVKRCLELLQKNNHHSMLQKAWTDFIKVASQKNDISTIEDLFKIANATILGITSMGTASYKTCSILPVSEKQIQISYDNLTKKLEILKPYSRIFNATYIPTVVQYNPHQPKYNGLLFYCAFHQDKIGALIPTLSQAAMKNMQLFSGHTPSADEKSSSEYESLEKLLPTMPISPALSSQKEPDASLLPNLRI